MILRELFRYITRQIVKAILLIFITIVCPRTILASSSLYFPHTNHQGSVIEVTDGGGNVVSKNRYFAYGEERSVQGNQNISDRKYTSQVKDGETELYYYNARYYDPTLGSFISPDFTNDQLNRYTYVSGNPIMFMDPTGNTHHTGGSSGRRRRRSRTNAGSRSERGRTEAVPCTQCHDIPELFPLLGSVYTPESDEYSGGRFSFGFNQFKEVFELASDYITDEEVTPFNLFEEWFTGTGPRERTFSGGDLLIDIVREHGWIDNVREEIVAQVSSSDYQRKGEYPYSLEGAAGVRSYIGDWIPTPFSERNIAVAYLGSYDLEYYITGVDPSGNAVQVTFHISNSSTLGSMSHAAVVIGYTDAWQDIVYPFMNNMAEEGPLSATSQDFWWRENINMGGE